MGYAWIIDEDVSAEARELSAAGTTGPRAADRRMCFNLKRADLRGGNRAGRMFRMLDDDGAVYYLGRMLDDGSATGFEPLDDFGMPNAGCTSIEYWTGNKWEML